MTEAIEGCRWDDVPYTGRAGGVADLALLLLVSGPPSGEWDRGALIVGVGVRLLAPGVGTREPETSGADGYSRGDDVRTGPC